MRAYGTAAMVTLAILMLHAAVMFGPSFAGFQGETLMVATAVVALVAWGTFLGLAIRALLLAVAVMQGDRSKLEASLRWTSALSLAAAVLSLGT
ncbi:hypothetical protein, partial [Hyalangium sp.]|uniref:hypothetical protein n=1 Tax=Hyalangium sp. TaxID=2028555 RepID=UPI002D3816D1